MKAVWELSTAAGAEALETRRMSAQSSSKRASGVEGGKEGDSKRISPASLGGGQSSRPGVVRQQ